MTGKPTRESGRIQTLHDLVNDDGYAALKRAGEDRDGWWRHRERISKAYRRHNMMEQQYNRN